MCKIPYTEEERLVAQKLAKKKYREKNKEKTKLYNKQYNTTNKEKAKQYRIINDDKIKQQNKKYRQINKEKINDYNKNYIRNRSSKDILYRLSMNIKNAITNSFKYKNHKKISRTQEILGCTYAELKTYIECQFLPWMSWDNYGKYNGELNHGWDIDHIKPLSTAVTQEDVISLNHYSNLQPLCSKINRVIKRDNY